MKSVLGVFFVLVLAFAKQPRRSFTRVDSFLPPSTAGSFISASLGNRLSQPAESVEKGIPLDVSRLGANVEAAVKLASHKEPAVPKPVQTNALSPRKNVTENASLAGESAEDLEALNKYCEDLHFAKRFPSDTVTVGDVKIGSKHPIAIQTMATSDTRNVTETVEQVQKIADEGFDMARLTVQGMQEAKACKKIREELDKRGYKIPLVADIHFQPKVGME
eukprot:Platyproteum_vivax@DN8956_c0_g1_i1.p1